MGRPIGDPEGIWGELTAVRERSYFDPSGKRREDVELLAGKRSVAITDLMTGFAELRELIDRQAAGVPRTRHRVGPHASPTPRRRRRPSMPAAELDDASGEAAAEAPSTDAGVAEDDGSDTQRGLCNACRLRPFVATVDFWRAEDGTVHGRLGVAAEFHVGDDAASAGLEPSTFDPSV